MLSVLLLHSTLATCSGQLARSSADPGPSGQAPCLIKFSILVLRRNLLRLSETIAVAKVFKFCPPKIQAKKGTKSEFQSRFLYFKQFCNILLRTRLITTISAAIVVFHQHSCKPCKKEKKTTETNENAQKHKKRFKKNEIVRNRTKKFFLLSKHRFGPNGNKNKK